MDNYLMHHGVKGQKWGVRNYQNEDGSYKSGAKGRYDSDEPDFKTQAKKFAKKKTVEYAKKTGNFIQNDINNRTKGRGVGKIIVNGILKEIGISVVGGLAASAAYETGHTYVGHALAGATSAMVVANTGLTVAAAIKRGRGHANN